MELNWYENESNKLIEENEDQKSCQSPGCYEYILASFGPNVHKESVTNCNESDSRTTKRSSQNDEERFSQSRKDSAIQGYWLVVRSATGALVALRSAALHLHPLVLIVIQFAECFVDMFEGVLEPAAVYLTVAQAQFLGCLLVAGCRQGPVADIVRIVISHFTN